jgi:hypothetical protein
MQSRQETSPATQVPKLERARAPLGEGRDFRHRTSTVGSRGATSGSRRARPASEGAPLGGRRRGRCPRRDDKEQRGGEDGHAGECVAPVLLARVGAGQKRCALSLPCTPMPPPMPQPNAQQQPLPKPNRKPQHTATTEIEPTATAAAQPNRNQEQQPPSTAQS